LRIATIAKISVALILMFVSLSVSSVVGLLASYVPVIRKNIDNCSDSSFSGVAFDPNTKTLLIADDDAQAIYEITVTGELVGKIDLEGFDDIEGIGYQDGRNFLVVEERRGDVVRIEIPKQRKGTIKRDKDNVLEIEQNDFNSGLEDVTYLYSKNVGYAVKEKSPSVLYKITFNNDGIPDDFDEIASFSWSGISGDAAGIYVLSDGAFLLLSEIAHIVYGVDISGKIVSQMHFEMTQPEGITYSDIDSTIYIVGEKREFVAFKYKRNQLLSEMTLNSHKTYNKSWKSNLELIGSSQSDNGLYHSYFKYCNLSGRLILQRHGFQGRSRFQPIIVIPESSFTHSK
jgi:uncharacterized protein YjiK